MMPSKIEATYKTETGRVTVGLKDIDVSTSSRGDHFLECIFYIRRPLRRTISQYRRVDDYDELGKGIFHEKFYSIGLLKEQLREMFEPLCRTVLEVYVKDADIMFH